MPPVSPEIVMTDPAAAVKSVFDTMVTVMVLDAPLTGLLCLTDFVEKDCAPAGATRHAEAMAQASTMQLGCIHPSRDCPP